MKSLISCLAGVALCMSLHANETHFRANETSAEKDARMEWWRDAKFGMFVHWGLYAGAEGKWKGEAYPDMRPGFEWLLCKGGPGPGKGGIPVDEYVSTLSPKMTLESFDPEAWAALAKEAGMHYFVITAKHHDGFGMVDFPDTDYDIVGSTPSGRDPMLERSIAYAEKMHSLGNHCEVVIYPGEHHSFFHKGKNTPCFADTVTRSGAFLKQIGFID